MHGIANDIVRHGVAVATANVMSGNAITEVKRNIAKLSVSRCQKNATVTTTPRRTARKRARGAALKDERPAGPTKARPPFVKDPPSVLLAERNAKMRGLKIQGSAKR